MGHVGYSTVVEVAKRRMMNITEGLINDTPLYYHDILSLIDAVRPWDNANLRNLSFWKTYQINAKSSSRPCKSKSGYGRYTETVLLTFNNIFNCFTIGPFISCGDVFGGIGRNFCGFSSAVVGCGAFDRDSDFALNDTRVNCPDPSSLGRDHVFNRSIGGFLGGASKLGVGVDQLIGLRPSIVHFAQLALHDSQLPAGSGRLLANRLICLSHFIQLTVENNSLNNGRSKSKKEQNYGRPFPAGLSAILAATFFSIGFGLSGMSV
jgi:hypothetical protein